MESGLPASLFQGASARPYFYGTCSVAARRLRVVWSGMGRSRPSRRMREPISPERPETGVTVRTGHMGYTFCFFPEAGGVDAVEGVFGDGRAPAVCRTASRR